jgi:hypothetical protein
MRACLLAVACAACQSAAQGGPDGGPDGGPNNLIVGRVDAGPTTPVVAFDNIGSSIHGVATMRDSAGKPVGDPVAVVIMTDVGNLCDRLKVHPDYFRNAPEAYEALIMTVRLGYLGTFIVGRASDPGTSAEIVASAGPQATTPFHAMANSYIALTQWSSNDGNALGSFNMLFDDPHVSGLTHGFYGRFATNPCATLEGTLLP